MTFPVATFSAANSEVGIGRQFERVHAMRLQTKRLPDARDRGLRETHALRHRARAPLRRRRWRAFQGPGDHLHNPLVGDCARRARPRLVGPSRRPLVSAATMTSWGHPTSAHSTGPASPGPGFRSAALATGCDQGWPQNWAHGATSPKYRQIKRRTRDAADRSRPRKTGVGFLSEWPIVVTKGAVSRNPLHRVAHGFHGVFPRPRHLGRNGGTSFRAHSGASLSRGVSRPATDSLTRLAPQRRMGRYCGGLQTCPSRSSRLPQSRRTGDSHCRQ